MPILYDQIGPRDRHRIGGKTLGLARLIGHGLPVPRAAVIPTDFFREFLAANGLWSVARKGGGPGLEAAIRQGRFPPDLARNLAEVGRVLGPMLAVRSSAVDEDGEEGSQAGQYISRLGVTVDGPLDEAVKDCWASLFSVNARSYRRGRGTPPSGMAVVIQSQVNPVSAGVMFTINPLTGSWNEMTVEAAWGLGESVVSGSNRARFIPGAPTPSFSSIGGWVAGADALESARISSSRTGFGDSSLGPWVGRETG